MNETTELIMAQLNKKKVHAETHEVGGGDEIDVTKLKNIESYVTKTGDFSGTWNGLAMTSVDGGLATAFNALKADTTQRGINVRSAPYNAVGDGIVDDTAAINNAFTAAYNAGSSLFLPAGTYRTTAPIGISTALTVGRGMPMITGVKAMAVTNNLTNKVQDGTIILSDHSGAAFRIINTDVANYFYGGQISNISFVRKNGDKSTDGSIGLSLKGCVDYRLFNVVCIGFEIGFKNDYGWSWDSFGLTCVRNNIGVLLEDNSNAVGLHGSQLHQNNVNLKILSGTNILVNKATLEGSPHGVVITKGTSSLLPSNIHFQNCYAEANTVSSFRIGKDENGVASSSPIVGVTIDSVTLNNPSIIPIQLDNANRVDVISPEFGQTGKMISVTTNTKNVSVNGNPLNFESSLIGNRYAVKNRLGFRNGVNLLPNGFLEFPDISMFTRGGSGLAMALDTTTFAGETVLKITVPDGTTNNFYTKLVVKVDPRLVGKNLVFRSTSQKDSGITATFKAYTPTYSGVSGGSVEMPTSIDDVGFYFTCPNENYMNISLALTNSSGSTKYVYIKTMVLVEQGVNEIIPSPIDYLSGLSGRVAATTTGTVVSLPGWDSSMYDVILTPYGNFTAYATIASNQFTVTSSANGNVSYLIIPKAGMFI